MRILMEFSYLGKEYSGYQIQPGKTTVQGELEHWLSEFFCSKINVIASGRTDSGVSAIRQIAHFDINEEILLNTLGGRITDKSMHSLAIRINYLLPTDIRIVRMSQIEGDVHTRYDAKSKTYCYNFYLSKIEIPYLSQVATWLKYSEIDIDNMRDALKILEGRHDFTSFCASNTDVEDKVRTITSTSIVRNDLGFYTISITGNGFLYNMVRIIVGTLIEIGIGKRNVSDMKLILDSRDRTLAGKTAPADGLVLKEVDLV
ncbi:MAG: tRNA pseudouridine(38-40) synthase TruA [Clostridiales bacterium]|nr:tRNA pseudouridine(38-40) synthase TruA [Clostridiales bacterium]